MSKALGEAAIYLPWLSPCAASLLALARAPGPAVWDEVRIDPGCVLLLARHALAATAASSLSFFPGLVRDAAVLDAARSHLENQPPAPAEPQGWVDWRQPALQVVYQASLSYAGLARHLAARTEVCDPDNAWVAGLLAPLGWLAAAAVDPCRTAQLLEKQEAGRLHSRAAVSASNGPSVSCFDAPAVARRLGRRWRLPAWLVAVTGHLGLPVEVAQGLGADTVLFRVLQLTVGLVERQGTGLGLVVASAPAAFLQEFGLDRAAAEAECAAAVNQARQTALSLRWDPPHTLPLLPDLLRLAAENRRLGDLPVLERLQDDVDVLQSAVEEQHHGAEERLRARKLAALAEFAAGAGHEINNPLAVISGQAQYLLRKVQNTECRGPDGAASGIVPADFCGSLTTIIGQTHRIHQLLADLMHFARPPAPQRQLVDVDAMIQDVAAALESLAGERKVRLVCTGPAVPVTLHADRGQLSRALTSLLRNAIEAAPAEGWAGVRVELSAVDCLDLVVEDNGRGPLPIDREHLFDPFYSGRKAGRGRGLGLPTAWRLARQHGGDVRLAPAEPGVTRFVLSLPLAPAVETPPDRNGQNGHPVSANVSSESSERVA